MMGGEGRHIRATSNSNDQTEREREREREMELYKLKKLRMFLCGLFDCSESTCKLADVSICKVKSVQRERGISWRHDNNNKIHYC